MAEVLAKNILSFSELAGDQLVNQRVGYRRSNHLLNSEIITARTLKLDCIIAMETKSIQTLENKPKT